MSKQCKERVAFMLVLRVCVLNADHIGRHQDSDGATWKERGT